MAHEIFISYSRKNLDKVKEIKRGIEQETGAKCWMDLNAIESDAAQFTQNIVDGINSCRVFLFMLTKESQTSKFALRELNFAMKKADSDKQKHVVIVNVDSCKMCDELDLLCGLRNTIAWESQPQKEKLLKDLKRWLGAKNGTKRNKKVQQAINPEAVKKVMAELNEIEAEREARENFLKGEEYYNNGNFIEAEKWFLKAAEKGDVEAQFYLGWMYFNGFGVTQSDAEAAKWLSKAAGQGHTVAQFNLGWMHQNGRGVKQSDAEAVKWYQMAAEQGNVYAQFYLGLMYQNGTGVAQDDTEAVRWYREAAKQGYAPAQGSLGWMYQNNKGVTQSDTEAVKWYRKAARQGDITAQFYLGWMYQNGRGVPQNDTEAVKWFRKAAVQGEANAQSNLGWMYQEGHGVTRSEAEAAKWYREAAKQGQEYAQFALKQLTGE